MIEFALAAFVAFVGSIIGGAAALWVVKRGLRQHAGALTAPQCAAQQVTYNNSFTTEYARCKATTDPWCVGKQCREHCQKFCKGRCDRIHGTEAGAA